MLEDGLAVPDSVELVQNHQLFWLEVTMHSGRNQIVRRMFETIGFEVKQLERIEYAGITNKNLPRGRWRMLTAREVIGLKARGQGENCPNQILYKLNLWQESINESLKVPQARFNFVRMDFSPSFKSVRFITRSALGTIHIRFSNRYRSLYGTSNFFKKLQILFSERLFFYDSFLRNSIV